MPSFFSRLKGKDGPTKASKKKGGQQTAVSNAPAKPRWEDAWTRTSVEPEEIQELLRGCTLELKSRGTHQPVFPLPLPTMHRATESRGVALHRANHGAFLLTALDMPFLLLPFRPTSDPSAARTFIRHFFDRGQLHGEGLAQELRLTEPMVRSN